MSLSFKSFGLSDIGLTRPNNEDEWVALPEIGFFALADGMGGHQAGEIAAKEALENLCLSARDIKSTDCVELIIDLKDAIEKANQWVYQLGRETTSLNGMGTTLCCLMWTRELIGLRPCGRQPDLSIARSKTGTIDTGPFFVQQMAFPRKIG